MSEAQTSAIDKNFSDIVAAIYRASTSPTLWRPALESLTREFGAFGAQLNVFDPAKGVLSLSISYGCEWLTPARLRRFIELSPTDPRMPYALAHPGMASHCRQAASEEAFHASPIYKEICAPGDCEYAMVVQMPVRDMAIFIGVLRHRAQRQFTHEDVGRFSAFTPHFRRSIDLGLALSQLDYSQQIASEAFEALPIGAALVSADFRVLHANGLAKALLTRLFGASGASVLPADAHPALAAHVVSVAETVAVGGVAPPLAPMDVLCSAGRTIRIRVTGIDDARAHPLLGSLDRNCAMVILEEADSDIETLDERLERMFGLTAAEIRVAKGVADGLNPKLLARGSDVSPETVRSQLKAVFRKTRTASQTELLQLLRNLPAWPSLPPPRLDEVDATAGF